MASTSPTLDFGNLSDSYTVGRARVKKSNRLCMHKWSFQKFSLSWSPQSAYSSSGKIGRTNWIQIWIDSLAVDVLSLIEVRWQGSDMIRSGDYVLIYSGPQDEPRSGVGLLMKRRSAQTLQSFWPVSDRVIFAGEFAWKPFDFVVIQVYAPTSESNDESIDAFYADLNSALPLTNETYTRDGCDLNKVMFLLQRHRKKSDYFCQMLTKFEFFNSLKNVKSEKHALI